MQITSWQIMTLWYRPVAYRSTQWKHCGIGEVNSGLRTDDWRKSNSWVYRPTCVLTVKPTGKAVMYACHHWRIRHTPARNLIQLSTKHRTQKAQSAVHYNTVCSTLCEHKRAYYRHDKLCELLARGLTTATVQWTSPRIDWSSLVGVRLWAVITL